MAIATTAYTNLELLEEAVVLLEAAVLVACGFLFFDIESARAKRRAALRRSGHGVVWSTFGCYGKLSTNPFTMSETL